jgi:hypothetical protein
MRTLFTGLLAAVISLGAVDSVQPDHPEKGERPNGGRESVERGPIVGTVVMTEFDAQYEVEQEQIRAYLAAVHEAELVVFYAGVQAELDRAAEAARLAALRPAPAPVRSVGVTVGECTGFAIPDYIIQRESGGNPSAANPSGAYGCSQTLLSHYSSGSCRGLDPYTIEGQRECTWILSNGGTNLSPWAQTR